MDVSDHRFTEQLCGIGWNGVCRRHGAGPVNNAIARVVAALLGMGERIRSETLRPLNRPQAVSAGRAVVGAHGAFASVAIGVHFGCLKIADRASF
jgi:hypothetical protein